MTLKDPYRRSSVSLRLAARGLLFVAPIVVTLGASCSKGSKVFSMKNQGAESVDVNATTTQDGSTSATFSKNATTSQRMSAGAGSGIDGAQVLIPAGGLSIDVNVILAQGTNNASDALAAALGLGSGFSGAGQPVVLSSTPPTDVSNPMQITLPPPSGASLWFNLAGDENWAVLYESLKVGENGTFYSGIIPRSELTVKDGKVVVTAKHFGTYQTVIPKVEVKAKIELPGRAVDLASSVTIKAPTLSQFGTSNLHKDPYKNVTITFTGDPEKLKDKFKEYRYTVDGTKPSCTEGLASSELTSNIGVTWGSVPVLFRAVACTVSGAASPMAEATYTFDSIPPGINISNPSVTSVKYGESVSFDISYSEAVVGSLDTSKIDITGVPSTSASLTIEIIDATSQTPKVRLSNFTFDGSITIKVRADAVVDTAGNANALSGTSESVTVKANRPTVQFSTIAPGVSTSAGSTQVWVGNSDKPTLKGTLSEDNDSIILYFDQNCAQAKSGFETRSGFESPGLTLTTAVTANVDTAIYAKATDADGNVSDCVKLATYKWDNQQPTVGITSVPGPGHTNLNAITLTFTFSEPVTGFVNAGQVTVTNATKGTFSKVNDSVYTLAITASGSPVSASVAQDLALDIARNGNIASTPWSIVYDVTAPTLAISSNRDPGPTNNSSITWTFAFSEDVTGFADSDITVTNGTKGTFTPVDPKNYTLVVTAVGQGDVAVSVAASVAADLAGNPNSAANKTVKYDSVAPSSSSFIRNSGQGSSVTSVTNAAPVIFKIQFNETIKATTFTANDITNVSGGVSSVTWEVASISGTSDKEYLVKATLASGTGVDIKPVIAASAVEDLAGNLNAAAITATEAVSLGSGGGTPPSSSAVYGDLSSSHERKVVFDGTRYWAFWRSPDGLKYGYYGTGGALTVIASPVLSDVQKFGVVGKSINSSYQVVIAYSEDGTGVKLVGGTVNGQTVSWGASQDIFTGSSIIKYSNPSVIFATDNKLVVAASQESQGLFEVNVKKSTAVYTSAAPGNFSSAGLKTPHKLASFGSLVLAPLGLDNFNVTISGADGAMVSYEGVVTAGSLTGFVPGITSSITSRPTSFLMAGRAGVSLNGNEQPASVNVMKVIAGELYIGGQFDSVGGIAANNVAKWNGWRWLPLGSGVSGSVNAIQEFNGKIYVGGLFSSAGNTAAQNIAAWDGRAWSAPGGVVDGAILAMAVSNDELFVGGAFSKFNNNTSLGRLVKTENGNDWSTADSGFGSGVSVTALHDINGVLYAAGYSGSGSASSASALKKFEKSSMRWPNVASLTGEIKAMASDVTHLYLVGGITAVSGVSGLPTLNKMVKVSLSATTLWSCVGTCSDFSPGPGSVNGILVEGDAVYVVGDFGIKLYESSIWKNVGEGLGGGPAKTLVRQAGKLIVGGIFKEAYNSLQESGKVLSKGIASFESAKWSALGAGFTQPVKKVLNLGTNISLVWTKGAGYLGSLYSPSGLFVYNDSAGWTSISLPGDINAANVSDVIVDSGTVYVAFATGTDNTTSKVFKYSAEVWAKVGVDITDYHAQRLIVEGNKIYALGRHVDHTTSPVTDILENMLSSGSTGLWPSGLGFGDSLSKDINDAIKIGNNFYVAHSTGVSRYEAAVGWTTVYQTFNGPVYSLAFSGANATGSLVAGGKFDTLSINSSNPVFNNLAAINLSSGVPEGLWVPIGAAANVGVVCSSTPCVASVNSLEFSGTQLYVGGRFDKVNGSTVSPNFAKVSLSNLSSPTWTALGYEAPLSSVSISGSDIWFGGAFGIARLSPNILAKVTSFSAISATSSTSLVYGDAVTGDLRRADYTGSRWTLSGGPISDANSNWPSFVNVGGTSTNYVVTWTTNGKLYYRKYTGTWAGIMSLTTFIDVSSPSISLDFATSGQIPVTFSRGNGFTTIESAQIP